MRDIATMTTSEIAYLAGRKPGTVRKLLETAGMKPVREDGRSMFWDAREALNALAEKLDFAAERARLAKEQADAQELRNRQTRLEWIPADDVELFLVDLLTEFRLRVMGVAPQIGAEAHDAADRDAARQVARERVRDALTAISEAIDAPLAALARAEERGEGAPAG